MRVNWLGHQADTERRANLADGLETRARIWAQCLVERFAGDTRCLGNITVSVGSILFLRPQHKADLALAKKAVFSG